MGLQSGPETRRHPSGSEGPSSRRPRTLSGIKPGASGPPGAVPGDTRTPSDAGPGSRWAPFGAHCPSENDVFFIHEMLSCFYCFCKPFWHHFGSLFQLNFHSNRPRSKTGDFAKMSVSCTREFHFRASGPSGTKQKDHHGWPKKRWIF